MKKSKYDINKRERVTTVGDLREALKDVPDSAYVFSCGILYPYIHVDVNGRYINFDDSSLEDAYEEE